METILQDVKHSVRLLTVQRGFALVAILTIALGTGASTAIFSVIDAALLRPLSYPDPDQLVEVALQEQRPNQQPERGRPSIVDVRRWRASSLVFSRLASRRSIFPARVIENPEPERVTIEEITEDYLGVYGVTPIQGRDLGPEDMRPEAPAVALLSHAYWQSRYGSSIDVIGRTVRLDGSPTTIVGVLPPTFGRDTPIWRPMRLPAGQETRRGASARITGRLRAGVGIEDAAREISGDARAQDATIISVSLRSTLESTRTEYRTTVNVLTGAVGLIMLIACVNVAGLLLARGSTRHAELAIRASLGAGRARLLRQLLTESVALAAVGGLAGVLLAWLTLDVIVANIPMTLPADTTAGISRPVLAAATALTLLMGLMVGLVPALRLSGVRVSEALARGSHRHGGALSRRGGQVLIAAEAALAVVLLAGAGLMIRSFARILDVDLGFEPASVLSLEVAPLDPGAQAEYYPALLERIRALPGVEAAGATNYPPLISGWSETRARTGAEEWMQVGTIMILPGFFEAMGNGVRQGRAFTEADLSAPVAMLNEAAARRLFPDGAAIGRRLEMIRPGNFVEVVGVVGNVRQFGPTGGSPAQTVYQPFKPGADKGQQATALTVVVRSRGTSPGLATALRDAAVSVGPRAIVERVRSGQDWVSGRTITPRRRTVLLSLLGGLGLLLTLVGVLGMTAYAVARRTQEIGVRMAFGARPGQVVGRMVRDSAIPVVIGVAIGIGGALAATRVIKTFLFETTPTDPLTLAAVAVTLAIAGTLAAWIPARRAARVDPVTALRTE